MNKKIFNLIALCVAMVLSFTNCSKDDDPLPTPEPEKPVVPSEFIYVLNSGNMGSNNTTLSMYNTKDKTVTKDVFLAQNERHLGDTGQDIVVYGSKMYIAVSGESTIEVTDLNAKSIKQIRAEGSPRSFAVHGGKVYVTYFNGYVARIDTASLEVEAKVQVGRNPEQLTVANGKLYVANSGGMDYATETGYDKTVSVVDIESFSETKKIEVVINPCDIVYGNNGKVYVVSVGNYGDVPNTLQAIDINTDEVSVLDDVNGTYLSVSQNSMYMIHSQYDAEWNEIIKYYSYDLATNAVVSDNFIGSADVSKPYRVVSDATSGDIYITSSDYINDGDVYVFDKTCTFVNKFSVGLNPIKAVRIEK